VAVLFAGTFGRLDTATLLWISTPIVMLAFAEAGYLAREKDCVEQANQGMGDGPVGEAKSLPTRIGLSGFFSALGAFSVWPFYLVLWGIFAASAINIPRQMTKNQVAVTMTPASPTILGAPNAASGMNHFPVAAQRPQYGVTNLPATYPAYPAIPLHTPATGYPRPATPVNFGPRPLVRPSITPPSAVPSTASATPGASPTR
jgi:hypothetical protein